MGFEYAIEVQNVSKSFKLYKDKSASLKDKLLFLNRNQYELHEVLNGVSFQVKRGESIGLIGENGCGKSTLLKLLSRIMYPQVGAVTIRGKVSSLLELGAGFHMDMTGRENIYVNASILGLSKSEIDQRLESIISFSELGRYIDAPVRTYSSGMYMRLAFSVAINVDADILLIDEILAVGDANFQAKCFRRLQKIKKNGTTIVIVSHSLGQIEQICDRSIWIDKGQIKLEGNPMDVHSEYLEFMGQKYQAGQSDKEEQAPVVEQIEQDGTVKSDKTEMLVASKEIILNQAEILNKDGELKNNLKTGDSFSIKVPYTRVNHEIQTCIFGFAIRKIDGTYCYGTNTLLDKVGSLEVKDKGTMWIHVEELNLLPGEYLVDLALHTKEGFDYDRQMGGCSFSVYSPIQDVGVVRLRHTWAQTEQ